MLEDYVLPENTCLGLVVLGPGEAPTETDMPLWFWAQGHIDAPHPLWGRLAPDTNGYVWDRPDLVWGVIEFAPQDGWVSDGMTVVSQGKVLAVGDRKAVVTAIRQHTPSSASGPCFFMEEEYGDCARAYVGDGSHASVGEAGYIVGGNYCLVRAGRDGVAEAGRDSVSIAEGNGLAIVGAGGKASSGNNGHAIVEGDGDAFAGDGGTAIVRGKGTAKAGNDGCVSGGDGSTVSVGVGGRAKVGIDGIARAGLGGVMYIMWKDPKGCTQSTRLEVGVDGIKPDTYYCLSPDGEPIEWESLIQDEYESDSE